MTTTNNTATQTNFRMFVLFVVLVLSSTGVFAQTTPAQVSVATPVTNIISTENAVASSMDFAVWFTGVKQNTNDTQSTTAFNKKQLINSGINTNNVLLRAFLKKVTNQGSNIA